MMTERTTLVYWRGVLGLAVLLLVATDAVLLGLGTGYFTGGFNSVYIESTAPALAYFLGAAVLDAALILGAWTLALPLLHRFGGGPFRAATLALLVALIPAVLVGAFHYHVHVTLGKLVSTSLLSVGSAGSAASVASVVADESPPYGAALAVLAGTGALLALLAAWRIDVQRGTGRAALPRLVVVGGSCLGALLAGALVLGVAGSRDERLRYGWSHKGSGMLVTAALDRLTDWDWDGTGWLATPSDPAPFDGSIHPYAVEIPGNGIDENGVGGDRPREHAAPQPAPAPTAGTARPDFLLVFLESFRDDLIEREIDGRPVTPFLDRLAEEGSRAEAAYIHSPWTLPSRAQLYAGHLVPRAGEPTLVDDFLERGYTVAHFSGQDDSYGDSVALLGLRRAHHFYDARQDIDRRTSRGTAAVSLQVSWKTVLEQVQAFLEQWPADRPLFLYVNFTDTHFPYTHDEVDDILGSGALSRRDIRAARADDVFRAYANTAANVDRAVEKLVTAWRRKFADRPSAVLVTGDHGESFYENGTLGHGQTLASAETRVPFILSGIGGDWPEPLAISDVRALLGTHLFRETPAGTKARFTAPDGREVFQYLGRLNRPQQIGMRTREGLISLDLRHGRARQTDAADQPLPEAPSRDAIDRLVWTWEMHRERFDAP